MDRFRVLILALPVRLRVALGQSLQPQFRVPAVWKVGAPGEYGKGGNYKRSLLHHHGGPSGPPERRDHICYTVLPTDISPCGVAVRTREVTPSGGDNEGASGLKP